MKNDASDLRGASRRQFLLGGAAAGLGAAAASIAVERVVKGVASSSTVSPNETLYGDDVVPFYGAHQAGVETTPQAHATFIALDVKPTVDRDGIRRMLRLLTDDSVNLTQGIPALADAEPELAMKPARLTITFGVGGGLATRVGAVPPAWLKPLPPFGVDRLEERWSHGDLLIHVASDDPLSVSHASRMLLKDSQRFTSFRWAQQGFRRARGTEHAGATMRNLFGQLDGTVNLVPGTDDFEELVWGSEANPSWLHGGTGFVLRRIAMDLDAWDRVDAVGRESAVGRSLASGAPLTGQNEHDETDFSATTSLGFPVIPDSAHIRRARSDDVRQRIFRRGYNYDERPTGGVSVSDSGLLFVSYQADVDRQFVPLQTRLDTLDMLNEWTTPIGSTVFAILPGCQPGGYVGETLFS